MLLEDFIIAVFCIIDEEMKLIEKQNPPRKRGPKPTLSDSEVLTMETVGEFLGFSQDKAIFSYFKTHFAHFFPNILKIHRTTFSRQAANLWAYKWKLWWKILKKVQTDWMISLVDSFPVPVCKLARAYRCKRFSAEASYGYDEMARQTFYGFRAHLRVCWPGVITGIGLAPANVSDIVFAPCLLEGAEGYALADRGYWSPSLFNDLLRRGVSLLAPFKFRSRPWPEVLSRIRRRIETVISQLVGRFNLRQVWVRDLWHFISRTLRKALAHTICVLLCLEMGNSPLRFETLISS